MDENERMKRILEAVKNPPTEVKETFRKLMKQFNKGLPPANSPEVLGRRCTW